jgi:hypothetical protein
MKTWVYYFIKSSECRYLVFRPDDNVIIHLMLGDLKDYSDFNGHQADFVYMDKIFNTEEYQDIINTIFKNLKNEIILI